MVSWRWLIIICTIPAFPALVMIIVLPESPLYLFVSGKQDKAMQVIRFLALLNRKELSHDLQVVCFSNADSGSNYANAPECSEASNLSEGSDKIALSEDIYHCSFYTLFGLFLITSSIIPFKTLSFLFLKNQLKYFIINVRI